MLSVGRVLLVLTTSGSGGHRRALQCLGDLARPRPAFLRHAEVRLHATAPLDSAFAARFKQLTGEGVMQYALHWRMQLAQMDLKEGKRTLAEIAIGLGYESEAAFARAFKRIVGTSPGAYRRQ
mgnify:CR=1 FL=1